MKPVYFFLAALALSSPVAAAQAESAAPQWQGSTPWPAASDPGLAKPAVQWQQETRSRIELVRDQDIPANAFGDMVRQGRDIFLDTRTHAGAYLGPDNALSCGNCHLGGGRKPHSAPLWGARPMYPAFDTASNKIVTLVERIQNCFENALGGTPPPAESQEMTALVAYSHWLSTGLPTGLELPGRNYPRLPAPALGHDAARGQAVYQAQCAICHGAEGQGLVQDGQRIFPPLWGKHSYSMGSEMSRTEILAGFIRANMPLGKPNSLSEQDAWDLAAYINGQQRPAAPSRP